MWDERNFIEQKRYLILIVCGAFSDCNHFFNFNVTIKNTCKA